MDGTTILGLAIIVNAITLGIATLRIKKHEQKISRILQFLSEFGIKK